ncbi:MAG: response regulator [Cyclobacteriaceae bacterium]
MRLVISGIFLIISISSFPQESDSLVITDKGLPPFKIYKSTDYQSTPASWGAIQDDRGILYFATSGGIIEFDGEVWEHVNPTWVQAFAKNEQGRIYSGSFGDFGYLLRGSSGTVEYVSLKPLLPEGSEVIVVRNVHILDGKVYFVSHDCVYIYDEEQESISLAYSENRMYPSAIVDGEVIVHVDQKGLHKVEQDSILPTKTGGYWQDKQVSNFLPISETEAMVLSSPSGAHYFSNDTAYSLSVFDHPYYRNNVLFGAKRLSNGYYALCFLTGGFVIANQQFEPVLLFNKDARFDNQVHAVDEDDEHNLWVGSNDGIIYINLTSQLSHIGETHGVEASVYGAIEYEGDLYTTGHAGVFRKHWSKQHDVLDGSSHKFEKIDNSEIAGIQLINTGESLFSLHNRKKGEIIDGEFVSRLEHNNTYHASGAYVESKNILVSTRDEGGRLEIFKWRNGKWEHSNSIIDERFPKGLLTLMHHEKETDSFWGNTYDNVEVNFKLNSNLDALESIRVFENEESIPDGFISTFVLNDSIFIGTSGGMYRHNSSTDKFEKDNRFQDTFDELGLIRLIKRHQNEYWFHTYGGQRGKMNIDRSSGNISLDYEMFSIHDPLSTTHFLEKTSDDKILYGTTGGLIVLDPDKNEDHSFRYPPLIRKVVLTQSGDSAVFSGVHYDSDSLASWNQTEEATLDSEDNALRFTYAVPFFKGVSKNLYRIKLEGFEDDWSEWSEKYEKDYTNIPSGSYSFLVQAKNAFGHESEIGSYKFQITPPWYLSIWAYLFYAAGFVLFINLLLKINSRRLRRENIKLEGIISERTKEITEQADKIKELDKVKTRFFSNISHEFRTPLTLIQGPIESILLGKAKAREEVEKNLKVANRNVKTLRHLIDEILEFNKMDMGELAVEYVSVDLKEYFEELSEGYQILAGDNDLVFSVEFEFDSDLRLEIPADQIEKVIHNLVSNAVKHSSAGAMVKLVLTYKDGMLYMSISDQGEGISTEDLDKIFERFYQSRHGKLLPHSSGIGLAYVKEIASVLDGDIKVESEVGKGSKFTFSIPAKLSEQGIDSQGSDDEANLEIDQARLSDYPHPNNKILIVEDNEELSNYIEQVLGTQFEIKKASNGQEALEELSSFDADLIISDIMMPVMDGMELLSHIKAHDKWKYKSVVMLTAKSSHETKIEALSFGLDDYLTKPFSPTELEIRVKNILRNQYERISYLSKEDESPNQIEDPIIKELIDEIEQNLDNKNFGVLNLSHKAALSDRQLTRVVKKSIGITPANLIREVKLQKAKSYLENKAFRSVSEISYSVGFEKPSYFSKVYFERYGKRPSEYLL